MKYYHTEKINKQTNKYVQVGTTPQCLLCKETLTTYMQKYFGLYATKECIILHNFVRTVMKLKLTRSVCSPVNVTRCTLITQQTEHQLVLILGVLLLITFQTLYKCIIMQHCTQ